MNAQRRSKQVPVSSVEKIRCRFVGLRRGETYSIVFESRRADERVRVVLDRATHRDGFKLQ